MGFKLGYDLLCNGTTGASLRNLAEQKSMDLVPKDDELRLLEGVTLHYVVFVLV